MAVTDPGVTHREPATVADYCREASFLAVVGRADGGSLAAAGILANALTATRTPFQVRFVRTRAALDAWLDRQSAESDSLVVGTSHPDHPHLRDDPAGTAYDVADALGATPDPMLALAGVVAGGGQPSQTHRALLEAAALERRPGVAIPTTDVADGLAHTTRLRGPFSGDRERAVAQLEAWGLPIEREASTDRRVASTVAAAVAGAAPPGSRASIALERVLRPYGPAGLFATLGGYGEVLDVLARRSPGSGLALCYDHAERAAALEVWRDHGQTVHASLEATDVAADETVITIETRPVEAVARCWRDFRSTTSAVVAVGAGEAGLASDDTAAVEAFDRAAATAGGSVLAGDETAYATFEPDDRERFVKVVREGLP